MLKERLQKGFTLIELMVVVSIIGILMAAGILAFSNAQTSARDAKRKADVDAISKALEQYNQNNGGVYPPSTTIATTALTSYFPNGALPADPQGGSYTITAGAASPQIIYCVCIKLEKPKSGNATTLGANGVCAYQATGSVGSDYQCASQRQ